MNKSPKISIITISFNSENTIKETIESVLSQDYKNIEYIIIDGNSTDKTKSIIGSYRGKISYFVSEKDNGIYDAMNKGIKSSTRAYYYLLFNVFISIFSILFINI